MKKIGIDKIIVDPRVQPRSELIQRAIDDYAIAMKDGAKFPPIVVFKRDDDTFLLAHGFHRYRGALKAGLEEINAEVREGDIHDAILCAVGANKDQDKVGVRWSNADKRRAVEMLLADEQWSGKSDNWIAKQIGVSQPFVLGLRKQVITVITSTREGCDGKKYPSKKAKKGGASEAKDEQQAESGTDQAENANGDQGQSENTSSRDNGPTDTSGSEGPCRYVGGSGGEKGVQSSNPKNGTRGDPDQNREMDWGAESVRIKGSVRALVRKFDALEKELDSLLAEIRDFVGLSRLEKEGEEIRKETLQIVRYADRIRQKFMD